MHAYANAHAYKQVLNKKRLLLKREEAEVRTDDTQARGTLTFTTRHDMDGRFCN